MKIQIGKRMVFLIIIAAGLSLLVGRLALRSWLYFSYSISFFGALYMLIGWLIYLKNDGLKFLNKFLNFYGGLGEADENILRSSYMFSGIFLVILSNGIHKLLL